MARRVAAPAIVKSYEAWASRAAQSVLLLPQRRDEAFGALTQGISENLRRRSLFHDRPGVEEDHFVGDAGGEPEIVRGHDSIVIKALRVEAGTGVIPTASLTLAVNDQVKSVTVSGDGPVDAIFRAIREIHHHDANLQLFQINAVTEGTDAQATVSVRLEENGRTVTGKASDTDTMAAAAYAYVNALNKLLVKREKLAPEALTVAR